MGLLNKCQCSVYVCARCVYCQSTSVVGSQNANGNLVGTIKINQQGMTKMRTILTLANVHRIIFMRMCVCVCEFLIEISHFSTVFRCIYIYGSFHHHFTAKNLTLKLLPKRDTQKEDNTLTENKKKLYEIRFKGLCRYTFKISCCFHHWAHWHCTVRVYAHRPFIILERCFNYHSHIKLCIYISEYLFHWWK